MSLFGKVLVYFVLVLIGIWAFLAAANAQKNKNWEAAIKKIQDEIAASEKELDQTKKSTVETLDQITQEQVTLGEELAVRRARQAEAEQMHSGALADLTRLKNLQATSEATQKNAEEDRDQRTAEVKAENEALAKVRGEVKNLQAVNKEQMDKLAQLREAFVKLRNANLARVSQLPR